MDLLINGRPRHVPDDQADPAMPLLWVLRDLLGMTGTKFGCGVAACGACTVHVDGQAVRACVTPLSAAAGVIVRRVYRFDPRYPSFRVSLSSEKMNPAAVSVPVMCASATAVNPLSSSSLSSSRTV